LAASASFAHPLKYGHCPDPKPDTLAPKYRTELERGTEITLYGASGKRVSVGGLPTYPANLCQLFGRAEFAGRREDLGQPIGEPVEAASRRAVRQGSTEHFDCVLSKEQRVNDTI
jgi:hypothetical protein